MVELQQRAREQDIEGRSTMLKSELEHALKSEDGSDGLSKVALVEKAQDLDVSGRSNMSKDELDEAIRQEDDRRTRRDAVTRADLEEVARKVGPMDEQAAAFQPSKDRSLPGPLSRSATRSPRTTRRSMPSTPALEETSYWPPASRLAAQLVAHG